MPTYEFFRLSLEVDNYGDNAVTNAFAQKTKLYADRLPPNYFKELVSHNNSFLENALFNADAEKTKVIVGALSSLKDGDKTVLKMASQESRFFDNALNNERVSDEGVNIIAGAIPLGSNLFGIIQLDKGRNIRNHITSPEQILQLMSGESDRSDDLKRDFESNPDKYMEYAVDIIKKPKLANKVEDKNTLKALNIIADSKNEKLNSLYEAVEKNGILSDDIFPKIAEYTYYLDKLDFSSSMRIRESKSAEIIKAVKDESKKQEIINGKEKAGYFVNLIKSKLQEGRALQKQ